MMGNIFGEIEFELNCWKLGVIFGRRHFAKYKFLDYLGSPEKD